MVVRRNTIPSCANTLKGDTMQYLSILIEADGDTVDTIEHGTDDANASLRVYVESTGFSLIQTYWHGSTLTAIVAM